MYNRIQLLGRIGQIERKTDHIVEASLATTKRYRDRESGESREDTQWHSLKFFNRLADIAENHVHKGDLLMCEGEMTYRKYTNAAGENRSVAEVLVQNLYLIPKGARSEEAPKPSTIKPIEKPAPSVGEEEADELPF